MGTIKVFLSRLPSHFVMTGVLLAAAFNLAAADEPKLSEKEAGRAWKRSRDAARKALKAQNFAEAEQHLLACVEAAESLDEKDRRKADAGFMLGNFYVTFGLDAQALMHLENALALREKTGGPEHAEVGVILRILGLALARDGQLDEAEEKLLRGRRILEWRFGKYSSQVAYALNALGLLYYIQGRYAEAEGFTRQAFQIIENPVGKTVVTDQEMIQYEADADPGEMAMILNNLALLALEQKRMAEAEDLLKRAVKFADRKFGKDHNVTATVLLRLGEFHSGQTNHALAHPAFERALAIIDKSLPPESPFRFDALAHLVDAEVALGRDDKARQRIDEYQSLLARKAKHPNISVAAPAVLRAKLHRKNGEYAAIIAIADTMAAAEPPPERFCPASLVQEMTKVGEKLAASDKPAEAKAWFDRSAAFSGKLLGYTHDAAFDALGHLARIHESENRWPEVVAAFHRQVEILNQRAPDTDPRLIDILDRYAAAKEKLNKPDEARPLKMRADKIRARRDAKPKSG